MTSVVARFGDRQDVPRHLKDTAEHAKKDIIAIGIATTTRETGATRIDDLALFKLTLPSIARYTEKQYVNRVYITHDIDDAFFSKKAAAIAARINAIPSLSVRVLAFDNKLHKPGPAMNFAMRTAYKEGADYLYRINDDTEFKGFFASSAIATLQAFKPPRVGVVGPRTTGDGQHTMTHDLVHRTHLDIFTTYYPVALTDWWLDDWMSKVYGDKRTVRGDFQVVHHTNHHGTRYAVTWGNKRLLAGELQKGKATISRFLTGLVIAYSLYNADNPRYGDGAIANCKLAPVIYPGWQVWIYHDGRVPQGIRQACAKAKFIDMSHEKAVPKMAWRFLPASMYIRAFISRDIDSRLSDRERYAVDEWLASNKKFHVMRDHPSHSNYPISGGMWGARGGAVKNIRSLMYEGVGGNYLDDMNFLRKDVWPLVRTSFMQHDSFSCDKWGGGRPFPSPRKGDEHVGSVFLNGKERAGDVAILRRAKSPARCTARTLPEDIMKWVSTWDTNRDALLCGSEVQRMPKTVRSWLPRFERLVSTTTMCLRFNMIELALWKLPNSSLQKLPTAPAWNIDPGAAYKFEGVPDFKRRCQWPYQSQESMESVATWIYHGKGKPWSWSPAAVQRGDIVAVRGRGSSDSFWASVHPKIRVPYTVVIIAEAEDVTPGRFAARANDNNIAHVYLMNHDERHAGESPKLAPFPIGQLWKTDGQVLSRLAAIAPAPLAATRTAAYVLLAFSDDTNPERRKAREALRQSLAGTGLLHEPNGRSYGLEDYGRVKFVVSPPGAGPDCHRTWEAVAMGAVPIVRAHKGLAPLYDGEPVLVVNEWSDVTPKLLSTWKPPDGGSKKVFANYWHNQLTAHMRHPLRDVLIGYAVGYGEDILWRLASAFHEVTRENADLVLFTSLTVSKIARFPRLKLIHKPARGNSAFERYKHISGWLQEHAHLYNRVIMTDTRDIALFDDPFPQIQNEPIQAFTEVVTYKYDHWYNQGWVRNCYGQEFLDSIMDELVTCCGVIAGTAQGMLDYLAAFEVQMQRKKGCDPVGTDTAIHVWIIHKELKGAKIVDSETAIIRHAPKWGPESDKQLLQSSAKYDERGRLLNNLGKPFALIHQLDRFPSLWGPYCAKHAKGTDFKVSAILNDQPPALYKWYKQISDVLPTAIPSIIKTLPHDAVIVDLGGNVGAFSDTLTRNCDACTVHIVEAVPQYARFIKHNSQRYNVYNVGLAAKPGSLDLWVSNDNLGWNTFIASKRTGDQQKIVVPTARFDDVVHVDSIDVLKIDVEGAEWMVLSGMHRTLNRLKCLPHLLMEIGWGTNNPMWPKLKEQLDYLHELGYPTVNVPAKTTDIWFKTTCPSRH